MTKHFDEIKEDIKNVKSKQNGLQQTVRELKEENEQLRSKLENIGQSRRNNIIIRGLEEKGGREKEAWAECELSVRNCLRYKLGIDADRANQISIERAHRLLCKKRPLGKGPHDVIVKMAFFKDKGEILSKAKEIKPEKMYFMEDFYEGVETERYKLKPLITKVKEAGLIAFLSFNKLIVINGEWERNVYRWQNDKVCALVKNFDEEAVPEDRWNEEADIHGRYHSHNEFN